MLFYSGPSSLNDVGRRATILFNIISSKPKKWDPTEGPVTDDIFFDHISATMAVDLTIYTCRLMI